MMHRWLLGVFVAAGLVFGMFGAVGCSADSKKDKDKGSVKDKGDKGDKGKDKDDPLKHGRDAGR